MAKIEIRKYDVMSMAKMMGVMGVIMGFIIGVIIAVIAASLGAAASEVGVSTFGFAAGLGVLAIIVVPIMYGIMLFVTGAIGAIIYNFIAEKIGGITFETGKK